MLKGAKVKDLVQNPRGEALVRGVAVNDRGIAADNGTVMAVTFRVLDGAVTQDDVDMCLRHISGRESLTGEALLAADIDGDGKVGLSDLMHLYHYVSGSSETL